MAKRFRHFRASSFKAKIHIIQRFIKYLLHNGLLQTKSFIIRNKLWNKFGQLIWYLTVAAFTGIIIYYAITNFNWISVGIFASLGQHYIDWFVKLIKAKTE